MKTVTQQLESVSNILTYVSSPVTAEDIANDPQSGKWTNFTKEDIKPPSYLPLTPRDKVETETNKTKTPSWVRVCESVAVKLCNKYGLKHFEYKNDLAHEAFMLITKYLESHIEDINRHWKLHQYALWRINEAY